jgi:hypothetical protein
MFRRMDGEQRIFTPREQLYPCGTKFTSSFTPRGVHSKMFIRMDGEQGIFTPYGTT